MEHDRRDETQAHWMEGITTFRDYGVILVVGIAFSMLLAGVLVSLGLAIHRLVTGVVSL